MKIPKTRGCDLDGMLQRIFEEPVFGINRELTDMLVTVLTCISGEFYALSMAPAFPQDLKSCWVFSCPGFLKIKSYQWKICIKYNGMHT